MTLLESQSNSAKKIMTGVEGGKFRKPKPKEEKELTEEGEKFVKDWGDKYEGYLQAKRRIEKASRDGESPLLQDMNFVENIWPLNRNFILEGELRNRIGATALSKMNLTSELLSKKSLIEKQRKRDRNFIKIIVEEWGTFRKGINIMGPIEKIFDDYKEIKIISQAINEVVDGLPEKKRKEYEEKYFDGRTKLSAAIDTEEKKRFEGIMRR